MALLAYLVVLFLAFSGHSNALFCVCKNGVDTVSLQKTLDYACGAGADCSQILQAGSCYQPNTVFDHCCYAVNSYYQRKNQVPGSCDFAGTAITSATTPATTASTCLYPASTSAAGAGTSTTPTTGTGTTVGGTTITGGTTTNGGTSTTTGGTTTNGGTTTTTGGTTSTNPNVYNLGPTANTYDGSGVMARFTGTNLIVSFVALSFSGVVLLFWG